MRDALVTHGVNVRPRKPRFESCPPRGLTVSGTHWLPPAPRRRTRTEHRRVAAARDATTYAQHLDKARLEMYQAQDLVKALKAAGKPFKDAAAESRRKRAYYLTLSGEMPTGSVEIAQASDANKVKAS